MFLGIDLGTSSVKTILLDSTQKIIDSASVAFSISRPKPLWSEQNPQEWWDGVIQTLQDLKTRNPTLMKQVAGIGLSGQMHGAVLLDKENKVLRPAILWNDGRTQAECSELESLAPHIQEITTNLTMAGFTAPKLLWVKKYENEIFQKTAKVLLPKDYICFKLTGEYVSDTSDASGTLWLDVKKRTWSQEILQAQGLSLSHMPKLVEGSQAMGKVKEEIKKHFGFEKEVIVTGAGDNVANAVGLGIIDNRDTLLSIGTSGVIFNVSDQVNANPELTVHSFCHAFPNTWHTMSVNLAVSAAINWGVETLSNDKKQENLIQNIIKLSQEIQDSIPLTKTSLETNENGLPIFLPYLSGERTPCNNSMATGSMIGLTLETTTQKIMYAILEGIGFNFRQSLECLQASGANIGKIYVAGGGTQNAYLLDLIASILNIELYLTQDSAVGGALGAARLAMIATGESIRQVVYKPKIIKTIAPIESVQSILNTRYQRYLKIYPITKQI